MTYNKENHILSVSSSYFSRNVLVQKHHHYSIKLSLKIIKLERTLTEVHSNVEHT